jgi:hypothetical protein
VVQFEFSGACAKHNTGPYSNRAKGPTARRSWSRLVCVVPRQKE